MCEPRRDTSASPPRKALQKSDRDVPVRATCSTLLRWSNRPNSDGGVGLQKRAVAMRRCERAICMMHAEASWHEATREFSDFDGARANAGDVILAASSRNDVPRVGARVNSLCRVAAFAGQISRVSTLARGGQYVDRQPANWPTTL